MRMIKLSDELHIPTMREILAGKRRARRNYAAAKITRTNRDWVTYNRAINPILMTDLHILRARSREMSRNAPHFRKFLIMAKANVIGSSGIRLQCRAEFGSSGRPNTNLNNKVENEFWEWGFAENCSASGKISWLEAQHLCVETLIRDGEVLIEHIEAADNPFGYSIKFWNVDYLDESFNATLPNGNRVIMSVEVDRNYRPVAYYLTTPTSERPHLTQNNLMWRERIPANRMTHIFLLTEDESQVRGVTWFHAALEQAKDMHEYTSGVVQQARLAAHTIGFLERQVADETEFVGGEDEEGNQSAIEIDVAPLSMNELPAGYSLKQFDPKQPNQNHAEFHKSIMLDIASGLGVNGFSLGGDLSEVNYSSARVGLTEEREVWRMLQNFVAQRFCREIYHRWLINALLAGKFELSAREYEQVRNPMWRPRGWRYVDPMKETAANIEAIRNNLSTYTDILAEQGIDLEEFLVTAKSERALFAKYGIPMMNDAEPKQDQPVQISDITPDEEAGVRGLINGKYEN